MKKLLTLLSAVIITATSYSQSPSKFSYQAVIRNSGGVLVQSNPVGIKISILQGSAGGSAVYEETHTVSTNINGLVTLEIGAGSVVSGNFGTINWSNGPYFLLTETDPAGGTSYTISGTSELLSVPYALYAKDAETADYNNLSNKPILFDGAYSSLTGKPTIPTTTGELTNNSGFITSYTETDPVFSGLINITTPANNQLLKYNSVSGKWENWTSDFITAYTETDPLWTAASVNYYTKSETDVLLASHTHADATITVSGFLSGADKTKLDGLTNADGSETVVSSGTNVSVTGSGTTLSPYVINASGSGWSLTGNAGTVDGTDFIGTTDNVPFNIRVNNQKAGRIDNTLANTFFGYRAGNSNTTGYTNTANGWQALYSNTTGYDNTANGVRALFSNTIGNRNTASGADALRYNTTGDNNTATGWSALYSNTTGVQNTANGWQALYSNTTGNNNSANGYGALQSNTNGANNTVSGLRALYSNTTGNNNTAKGGRALYSNVAGSNATAIGFNAMQYANSTATPFDNYNVAVGFEALRGSASASANTGNYNTALGSQTLYSNTTGTNNTASGNGALFSNTTGANNTASGNVALLYNTTGSQNTASGQDALAFNTTGTNNTASGQAALNTNVAGNNATAIGVNAMQYANSTATPFNNYNVAVGFEALRGSITASANTGNNNTAVGYQTLRSNSTGAYNIAVGDRALFSNTTGNNNIAYGPQTLYWNNTGSGNMANGLWALFSNTTGNANTAIGLQSLYNNTTGSTNTALGYGAGTFISTGSNNIVIGFSAQVPSSTANNQVRIGDANITYAGIQVGWTITSDRRWKSEIENSNLGLDFITKLRPVSYVRNNDDARRTEYGFIGQEMEEALYTFGAGNTGIITKDDKGMYSVRYNDLLSPMVKAIQELDKQKKELTERVDELEAMVKSLLSGEQKTSSISISEWR